MENATPPTGPDPSAPHSSAPRGLPPVEPPSGRFIAQLFLVPGMIVLVAVLIILAINYLFVGGYSPEYFLAKLDSDNADIRWRGASDLAQWIKRKESQQLRTDVAFALDLAQRLDGALADLDAAERDLEQKIAKLPEKEQTKARRKLDAQRHYVEYLASALGDFYVPVGAPLLCAIMNQEAAVVKASTLRRRRAVWSLANLGSNVKTARSDFKEEQRQAMVAELRREMNGTDPRRAGWAATALHSFDPAAAADNPNVVRVDRALAQAARNDDRYLREHVAMALNFWDGPDVEATLLRLTRDDGFGTLIRVGDGE